MLCVLCGDIPARLTLRVTQLRESGIPVEHCHALLDAMHADVNPSRCRLARAIALEPELLFLDEPTSGADPAIHPFVQGRSHGPMHSQG